MTQRGASGVQPPDPVRQQHIRRHQEARRRERRRRVFVGALVAAVVILACVAAVAIGARWLGGSLTPGAGSSAGSSQPSASAQTAVASGRQGEPASEKPAAQPSATPAAEASATPKASPTPKAQPTPRPVFKAGATMEDVRMLADFGVRSAGSSAEGRAAKWAAAQMRAAGAEKVTVDTFSLPNGKTSRDVVARFPGTTDKTIVIGAHMDSKAPSPGANDNGTGSAAVLEFARCLGKLPAYPTVVLVLFGSEEMIDANPDHHHFGSRQYVAVMSRADKEQTVGMVSVDMIGYGPAFVVRTMGRGPQNMRYLLLAEAKRQGLPASYLVDPGPSGWSDHEAFELAGIPAAWIEWRDDPVYHTTGDTPGHISAAKVRAAGQLVLSMLYGLDERGIRKLER